MFWKIIFYFVHFPGFCFFNVHLCFVGFFYFLVEYFIFGTNILSFTDWGKQYFNYFEILYFDIPFSRFLLFFSLLSFFFFKLNLFLNCKGFSSLQFHFYVRPWVSICLWNMDIQLALMVLWKGMELIGFMALWNKC